MLLTNALNRIKICIIQMTFCISGTFIMFPLQSQESHSRPIAIQNGKIFNQHGEKYLFGGESEHMHFKITDCLLKDEQFHYGIGRERFPALLRPEFESVKSADAHWSNEDRFLVVSYQGETKAYSIDDLTRHEVVNDSVGDKPIFAAYCILADLGAIYDRVIGDKEFTFALSGYTYYDPEVWDGMDGFVLWDRETESLWWPLIGKAVSGKMKNTEMQVMDETYWKQTTWKDVKIDHSIAQVLISNQDFERPKKWWRSYKDVGLPNEEQHKSIAPKWGKNKKLGKN